MVPYGPVKVKFPWGKNTKDLAPRRQTGAPLDSSRPSRFGKKHQKKDKKGRQGWGNLSKKGKGEQGRGRGIEATGKNG